MEHLLIISYNDYDDCYLFQDKSDGNITTRIYRIIYDELSTSYDIENNGNKTLPLNYYEMNNDLSKLYFLAKNAMINHDYTKSFVYETLKIHICNEYSPISVYKERFSKCDNNYNDLYIALDKDDIDNMLCIIVN